MNFKYEKLSLFCFLCGLLGHRDRFCRKRIDLGLGEVEYGWDIMFQAKPMRVVVTSSMWIREEPMERNFGNFLSDGRKEQNEMGTDDIVSHQNQGLITQT